MTVNNARPVPVVEKKSLCSRMRDYRVMYAFLLPAIIVVIIFAYIPM